jgi:hypothetical protein
VVKAEPVVEDNEELLEKPDFSMDDDSDEGDIRTSVVKPA